RKRSGRPGPRRDRRDALPAGLTPWGRPLYFTSQSMRRLRVKLILPALTEATSPYWRPIKYSLFPPLGLATLAAYLAADDEAVLEDEHVGPLAIDDRPDLVVIQVYITSARRAYRLADHYRARGAFVVLG